ncbi:MAG: hypothetical protein HWN68_11160 [Desulfobacterales bacterium]|nr:hypothetical protein [Desulfobacterales bacterium]
MVVGPARAIFRTAIPDFLRRGFSVNAMIREARAWGVSYRRTEMLGDVREFQGYFVNESRVRTLDRDVIPSSWYMQETDLRRIRRYRVHGNITYRNPLTGEEWTKPMSLYDDTLKTLNEWEEDYKDDVKERMEFYEIEVVGIDFRAIQHNRGFEY